MKFTKEQRSAIIQRVSKIANDEYQKKLKEAMDNYVPSENYKRLEKALHDREEACKTIKELWGDDYVLRELNVDWVLNSVKRREIDIKELKINKEDLETEIILNQCDGVEELISHLLELVSKNNNN